MNKDIKDNLQEKLRRALEKLGIESGDILLEHPGDISHGDYSTNTALAYARQAGKNPRDLAQEIVDALSSGISEDSYIEKIEIAGPGFINFRLSRRFFADATREILKQENQWGRNNILEGKKVMVEYTQPNPFKPFHIGHLMSNAIGESISRIVEFGGADVVRANYQGDVGLHVAKAIYGLMSAGMPDSSSPASAQAQYIGECYAKGSDMYDNDPSSKEKIDALNKKVYDRSDEEVNKIYDWGRKVTLDAFEKIYATLGTKFDRYFFESEMAVKGERIVRENIPAVFEESDGAVVFHADKYDPKLHTRVFLTSSGLPLYEAKEIGLTVTKFETENPDLSIVTTAIEQGEYMKVVSKALSIMHPEYESRMKHIAHGMMRLASGKMSSRKGNVITGESLLNDSMSVVAEKIAERELPQEEKDQISKIVGVAALKYSILRSSLGSDIIYDFEKSISFEGDSGPYLQYTAVRANSILNKGEPLGICPAYRDIPSEISLLEKLLYRFPEVVLHSYEELEPHHVATYLTELSSAFNTFYAHTPILNKENPYASYLIAVVEAFYLTMKQGSYLLGIKIPEKM